MRRRLLWTSLALLVSALALTAHGRLRSARARAAEARERLVRSEDLLARIDGLSQRPQRASREEIAVSELTRRIEAAARAASIGAESLYRIEPEPARRTADGPYLEKPTRVELRGIGLAPLLDFLETLGGEPGELTVTSLRLQAPHSERLGDTWDVEATLTYLIYSPRDPRDP